MTFALACSSDPGWVAADQGSLCTLDYDRSYAERADVDVWIVVDDSPSAAASRPMFRARILASLRALLAPRKAGDGNVDAAHDVHLIVRGASSGYERRLAYLAPTADNQWKTPHGELVDPEDFIAATSEALSAIPTGDDTAPLTSRLADLHVGSTSVRGRSWSRVLVATTRDDDGPFPNVFELPYATTMVVLLDERPTGAEAPSAPPRCMTTAVSSTTKTAVPRLVQWTTDRKFADVHVVGACSDDPGPEPLLGERIHTYASPPVVPGLRCTLLLVPPIAGEAALCDRPNLGLERASPKEAALMTDIVGVDRFLHGHPVCKLTQDEAEIAPYSWVRVHCEGPTCP